MAAEFKLTSNGNIVTKAFERAPSVVGPAIVKTTTDFGYRGLALIKRNTSGRPGPNVITGDYRRGWYLAFSVEQGNLFTVVIFNNSPQGPRLEYGFFGTDSLGRTYRQRAYPHVAPAMREIRVPYQVALITAAVDALKKAA